MVDMTGVAWHSWRRTYSSKSFAFTRGVHAAPPGRSVVQHGHNDFNGEKLGVPRHNFYYFYEMFIRTLSDSPSFRYQLAHLKKN
jgi:hypothetical protein